MEGKDQVNTPNIRRFRFLHRGESMVASTGLAVAAILLASMGASALWASHTYQRSLEVVQRTEFCAVSDLLAGTSTSLLETGELTALRRVLADVSRKYNLETCRIVLPDGRVVADAIPGNIDTLKLPGSWEGTVEPDGLKVSKEDNLITAGYALNIPGHGQVRLELISTTGVAPSGFWEFMVGCGLVGAVSLIALLVVYRRMRSRLSAMGAIREALKAFENGETCESALRLSAKYGSEAVAWNELLNQKQLMNKQLVEEKAGQMLGARQQGHSDMGSICDSLKQGLILLDENLQTRYINGAATVLLRATREQCMDLPVSQCIQEPRVLKMLEAVVKGEVRRWASQEIELDEISGHTGVIRFSARPVREEDNAAAMIIIEDLTQQRVADDARASFVNHATHELRTPLTNIRLYVETAIEEGEDDPSVRANCLNVINQESRRLERIVGDMLSVSQIEAGSIQLRQGDVRLEAVMDQVEGDYQAMAREKNINLTFDLPPKLPVMQGDRDKIVLAMHNLMGNALKYTPDGGQVTVRVDSEEAGFVFEVNDSGIGVDSDEVEQIFEKFYRARNSRDGDVVGSGLGLSLAREVVRLHGGDITVQSEINQGSKFTMTLPILSEAA